MSEFIKNRTSGYMTLVVIPKDLKRLRCCLRCHLIKNVDQFVADGCENCPELWDEGIAGEGG